jgi:DNA-directed RNA polymerase sigma subunit (sigma70/sigma32)
MLAGRRGTGNDPALLAEVADVSQPSMADRFAARDEVRRLLGQLNDREQTVVRAQFGLEGSAVAREQLTEQLGVTPQQLRQIEKTAIAKLRSAMGEAV